MNLPPAPTFSSAAQAGVASAGPGVKAEAWRRVVDAPTRTLHWLLALSFSGAYLSAESERWHLLHITLGYTALGLVLARLLWALLGPRRVRASVWWNKLRTLPAQLRAWRQGRGSLAGGFQALNAVLVLGLLASLLLTTLSGMGLELEWWRSAGEWLDEALEEGHELMGNLVLALALAHIGLVLGTSLLRGQNLAGPMLSGKSPGRGPDLVQRNGGLLAALILAAVLGFWAWQWLQDKPLGLGPEGSRAEHSQAHPDARARQGHREHHDEGDEDDED